MWVIQGRHCFIQGRQNGHPSLTNDFSGKTHGSSRSCNGFIQGRHIGLPGLTYDFPGKTYRSSMLGN